MFVAVCGAGEPFVRGGIVVPGDPARADYENVGGVEGGSLGFGNGVDVGEGDFVTGGCGMGDFVFKRIGVIVY